jgi:PIN domain nuclease of toxin-antitoxin system
MQGYLLDSHAFLWAASAPEKLSPKARRICELPRKPLVLSVVSLWEIIAKCQAGKLRIPEPDLTLPKWAQHLGLKILPVETAHACAVYSLPLLHGDPFDRILLAQALTEGLALVTKDADMSRYAVECIW